MQTNIFEGKVDEIMNIKKLTSALLVAVMVLCTVTVPSFASGYKDVDDSQYFAEAVNSLSLYGIVSGYAGYFNPTAYVTRAEYAKMITLACGLDDEVYSSTGNRKFDDVPVGYWGIGYVNTSANNKLIVGYPNGLFLPENNITFAEAVTVLLRAMDYTTADLGDNWPYSYMVKAASLGLTDGVQLADNSYITRADLAVIINRALQTELNGSTKKMISKMDINMTDEVLVIATKNEDKSLDADTVKTDSGTYRLADTNLEFTPLTKVKLVLNDNNEVINFVTVYVPEKQATTVDSYVSGTTYFANGVTSKSINIKDSTPVYTDGTITNYGAYKDKIEDGAAVLILYDKNGAVSYLVFSTADMTEPAVIRTDVYSALASVGVNSETVKNAKVIRNGYASSLDKLQTYDVVYYFADNDTVYAYSDKLSGVYTDAFPNKAAVSSIEISGTTVELETQTAAYKLGEKAGSYKLNSKITALLGKDGKVVDVVDLNTAGAANYGILLSVDSEMSTDVLESGRQTNYIVFMNGEGNTVRYKTQKDYSEKIGDVGKVEFDSDGYALFSNLTSTSSAASVGGAIDKNNKKIGDRWLTSDCVIIERTYAPDTRTGVATAKVIDFDEIKLSALTSKQIIYAVTSGDFGDISLLIVEGVTKAQSSYGIITGTEGGSASGRGTYEILADGTTNSYSASFYKKIPTGTGVSYVLDSKGQLTALTALIKVGSTSTCSALDFTRIKIGSDVFEVADNVQIFRKNGTNSYISMSMSDAEKLKGVTVNAYADASPSLGGTVRVIVFNQ